MNKKGSSGSGIFMMEMIVAVFFFILCASICILVFVRSDNMSKLAKDMNQGVMAAESMTEVWKAKGPEGLAVQLGGTESGQEIRVYWDDSWKLTGDRATAAFCGVLSWQEVDGVETADISVNRIKDEEVLFDMIGARYLPKQG